MYSHITKVVTEAWFEEGTGSCVERLAGRAQYLMHYWWCFPGRGGMTRYPLEF
jgi:hypothetical protein